MKVHYKWPRAGEPDAAETAATIFAAFENAQTNPIGFSDYRA